METLGHEIECEAEYQLESSVRCAHCGQQFETVQVIRLLRKKVNFTSSLPRRGYLVVCPHCQSAIPAVIGARGLA
ncbi:MAG TPA: hypothetical protein VD788_18120 [Candidatus Polarisedimenticolaceae bacterium]|nr:hypothetical protein [Candidatus Polarisedimenticolaceae bacterium]